MCVVRPHSCGISKKSALLCSALPEIGTNCQSAVKKLLIVRVLLLIMVMLKQIAPQEEIQEANVKITPPLAVPFTACIYMYIYTHTHQDPNLSLYLLGFQFLTLNHLYKLESPTRVHKQIVMMKFDLVCMVD